MVIANTEIRSLALLELLLRCCCCRRRAPRAVRSSTVASGLGRQLKAKVARWSGNQRDPHSASEKARNGGGASSVCRPTDRAL